MKLDLIVGITAALTASFPCRFSTTNHSPSCEACNRVRTTGEQKDTNTQKTSTIRSSYNTQRGTRRPPLKFANTHYQVQSNTVMNVSIPTNMKQARGWGGGGAGVA